MKNIGAIILLMMSCWASSQAISKKQLEQLNMNVSGYTIYPFGGEFAAVKNATGRYSIVDKKGELAYPFEFDTITFSPDYINLVKKGKSILLNSKGTFLLDSTQYSSIVLDGNFARVVNKVGKHGCYGKNFEMVLPNNYNESDYVFYGLPNSECMFALKSSEGKWAIRSSKNGQETEYIYDKAPKQIKDQYLKVYRQGLCSVFDGGTFRDVLPYREYIDSCSFWNNDVNFFVAMDKSDSLSYIYNSEGKKVALKPSTEFCYWKNKYVVVSKGAEGRNIPLKMLNKNGKEVHILKVTDELCWQYKNNKWTFKSTSGKRLAGPFDEFAFLDQDKEESLFIVGNDGKYGLVNMKGKTVIPLDYAAVQFHHSGHIKVFIEYDPTDSDHSKDKFKFYNNKGKQLKSEVLTFDPFVDSCASQKQEIESTDYMWFRNTEGKYGLCRMKDMKVLVPFVCDECGSLMSDGMAVAVYGGRRYYINEKGEGLPAEAYKK